MRGDSATPRRQATPSGPGCSRSSWGSRSRTACPAPKGARGGAVQPVNRGARRCVAVRTRSMRCARWTRDASRPALGHSLPRRTAAGLAAGSPGPGRGPARAGVGPCRPAALVQPPTTATSGRGSQGVASAHRSDSTSRLLAVPPRPLRDEPRSAGPGWGSAGSAGSASTQSVRAGRLRFRKACPNHDQSGP